MSVFLGILSQRDNANYGCDSDYGWSTWSILIIQSFTVLLCWVCVTIRCARPLLVALEYDSVPKVPNCLNLRVLWHESAFKDDVLWWRTHRQQRQGTNTPRCKGQLVKRVSIMCKMVPLCMMEWLVTVLCAWPSMFFWLLCWKLSRYPASWLLKWLYTEEQVVYFKQVIEPEFTDMMVGVHTSKVSSTCRKLQGLWLANKPRDELQTAVSKERACDVGELVDFLRDYDRTQGASKLEMNAEWPGLDRTRPWPLSVCVAALVLMEVWRGIVFVEEEVDLASKALWQAGQVAHLAELLTNVNTEARRATQRVLVDLFTTKKAVSCISSAFRTRCQPSERPGSYLDDTVNAAHAVLVTEPDAKLWSTAKWLETFANALLKRESPRGEDKVKWMKSEVKQYAVIILGDYFQRFPEFEMAACSIARQYDCGASISWAHQSSSHLACVALGRLSFFITFFMWFSSGSLNSSLRIH